MSQIEQDFRQFLSKRPEIERCYKEGLINRRSLARYLIRGRIAKSNQMEALVAMLRRYEFKDYSKIEKSIFKDIRINIKDKILVLDFEKNKELLKKLEKVIANTDYDKGDTLKIVVGTAAIKVFIDKKNENKLKELFKEFKLKNRFDDISEISLQFSDKAMNARGILSTITNELLLNDISINELLTGAPELLIYLKDKYVLKAYEILKRLRE
jgi:hypothetical protein